MYNFIAKILNWFSLTCWYIKRKDLYKKMGAVGHGVSLSPGWSIPSPKNVFIGNDVFIGEGVMLSANRSNIYIGNHVLFGPNVHIHGGDHRYDIVGRWMKSITIEEKRPNVDDKDVYIDDDVWIGDGAIILKGVTVARGSIIGARAIVTKNTQPYDIVVGNNRVVAKRFSAEEIILHEEKLKNN